MTISQLLFLYHFIILFWVGNINLSNPYNYCVMNYEPLLTTENTGAEWIKDFKCACPKLTLDTPLPTPPSLPLLVFAISVVVTPFLQLFRPNIMESYLTPWFLSHPTSGSTVNSLGSTFKIQSVSDLLFKINWQWNVFFTGLSSSTRKQSSTTLGSIIENKRNIWPWSGQSFCTYYTNIYWKPTMARILFWVFEVQQWTRQMGWWAWGMGMGDEQTLVCSKERSLGRGTGSKPWMRRSLVWEDREEETPKEEQSIVAKI